MTSRSQQLRRRQRRIFGLSLLIAVLVHVAVFAFSPQFRSNPADVSDGRTSLAPSETGEVHWIDVEFGPPKILLAGGLDRQEPPDRVLQARDVLVSEGALSEDCRPVLHRPLEGIDATVRLEVGRDGRVRATEIAEGSGNACVDEIMVVVAGTLWYHWLPDDEAPPPVELFQPMRVSGS